MTVPFLKGTLMDVELNRTCICFKTTTQCDIFKINIFVFLLFFFVCLKNKRYVSS